MWKRKSIDFRLRALNVITFGIVAVLIIISVALSINGMRSLRKVLDANEKTRLFWAAVENEEKAFSDYLNTEQPQAYESLVEAGKQTEQALSGLPYNYKDMTVEQYAQTSSIKNTYNNYKALQQEILTMNSGHSQYKSYISRCYVIQQYLESYASRLQTMTVQESSVRYHKQKNMYFVIPVICIVAGIMVILTFLWFKAYIRKVLIKPVMALSAQAKRIAENDFSEEALVAEGEDEIAVLINAFNEMKDATRNYIDTINEKHKVEKQLVETRYHMLKNQINPHFLFNTLNLIASTAEIEDATTTEKMIVTLSRLFRYNLKSQTTVMPLEQELKVVSDYMYLQQMRFGQRIKYVSCPDENTLQVLVPSFVLQPLVENAVIHGLSKSSKGGVIVVRSWQKDGLTWISVADTGEGMDEETYRYIKKKLEAPCSQNPESGKNDEKGTGIALVNIAERIQGMYHCSGVRLYSKKGCGTAIQLYLGGREDNV